MAFETNGNLKPASTPELWADERAKEGAGANARPPVGDAAAEKAMPESDPGDVESVERQMWGDDPAIEAEQADIAEQFKEPAKEEPAEETAEEAPDATPRAQQRIQQLATQAREQREEIAGLRELVEAMKAEREERQRDAQEWREQQKKALEQEREAQLQAQWDEYLLANGQDPKVPTNRAGFEAVKQVGEMRKMLEALQQREQQRENAEKVQRYVSIMHATVDEQLKAHNVSPKQVEAIKRSAYAQAAMQRIADPAAAVAQALAAYQNEDGSLIFPKKQGRPVKPSQPVDHLIASRGSRGDAQTGQLASGKKAELTLEQMEKNPLFWLGR